MNLWFIAIPEGQTLQSSELGTGFTCSAVTNPFIQENSSPSLQTHLQGNPADNQLLILGVLAPVIREGNLSLSPGSYPEEHDLQY